MFEKSLYDLIKGLRSHKGAEKEYIDNSLRECRQEIRGSDMDLKATALLKLVYLEMFGHDMSWASFNILEVMSAPKYHQKRVGYLGAVQTFGPGTDVLMLATNLLKKDVTSANVPTISLPLVAIPHLVTPGLANAVVPDLLTRMSHSSPNVRKKAITTLYRLALVWPEALRPAWPKMKEILENEDEVPEVTATVVNVVCELVWRRPEDFLPLAPRFFDLLIHGGNNWMVIKLIKLFATLTPLEPRLIKKLAPALTNLIRTTPAMSVLYECIHGIIQGGILDGAQGIREGDEIAGLCVSKLCGMIAVDGDPNLKYVALLAFNKIVLSHPQLVSAQQDIITSCLDDGDISIRTQALTLVSGMVDVDTLMPIVDKLMDQLRQRGAAYSDDDDEPGGISTAAGTDLREYQISLAQNILEMCRRNIYANISDFDWYIDILVQLVEVAPSVQTSPTGMGSSNSAAAIYDSIGSELRNVATRVKAARLHATEASGNLISALGQHELVRTAGVGAYLVLSYAAFIVGEYPGLLPHAQDTLSALLLPFHGKPHPATLCAYIQASLKVLSFIFSTELADWSPQRQSIVALLLARVVQYLEGSILDEDIEVQERASTALELMRLAEAALSKHEPNALTAPSLVADIVPSLFTGPELNPIAIGAQDKVPVPEGLDLDEPINDRLMSILLSSEGSDDNDHNLPAASAFYHNSEVGSIHAPTTRTAASQIPDIQLYDEKRDTAQEVPRNGDGNVGNARRERELYDPFYIGEKPTSGISTPVHEIIQDSNGHDFDIDSIPIMELELGKDVPGQAFEKTRAKQPKSKKSRSKAQIIGDETIDETDGNGISAHAAANARLLKKPKTSRPLLGIDSSGLGSLSSSPGSSLQHLSSSAPMEDETHDPEEEMKKALAEVERLRLEMQRAQEKVSLAEDIPEEGTLITKKKKKKDRAKSGAKKKRSKLAETEPPELDTANGLDEEVVQSYQS